MAVPGRVAAAALLLSFDPPPWFLRHARAVGEIAGWLGVRLARRGVAVDRRLAEAAGLLHDIDKLLPVSDAAHDLPHGEGSADWLARQGLPELGPAVANHPVTRLADRRAFLAWLAEASLEERIVAYADKRAGQRLEALDARFRSWTRRYPNGWPGEPAGLVRSHAGLLETDVCRLAGVAPKEVGRLPWTGAALRAARATARTAAGAPAPREAAGRTARPSAAKPSAARPSAATPPPAAGQR
jgi:hypothetical protein